MGVTGVAGVTVWVGVVLGVGVGAGVIGTITVWAWAGAGAAALLKCPPRANPTTATIATMAAALIEAAAMKNPLEDGGSVWS